MKRYFVPVTQCTEYKTKTKFNQNFFYLILVTLFLSVIVTLAGIGVKAIKDVKIAINNSIAQKNKNIVSSEKVSMPVLFPETTVPNSVQPVIAPSAPTENTIQKKESFSFAVIGDSQSFETAPISGNLQKAVNSISLQNPDLVFAVGDLIADCEDKKSCQKSFDNWKKIANPVLAKTYTVVGNHDHSKNEFADSIWQKTFTNHPNNGPAGFAKQTYSLNYQNVHFVVLNSSKPKEHTVNLIQRDWLEKDLARHKGMMTFVFYYEPAFSTRIKRSEGRSLEEDERQRDALWNIISRYRVKAVFNGHEHFFSRMQRDGIYQFIIGNTDAPQIDAPKPNLSEYFYQGNAYAIVTVAGQKVNLKLYTVDGGLVHSFDF